MLSVLSCAIRPSVYLIWRKCLFKSFAQIWIEFFVGCWVLRVLTIFWILISHQIIYRYFLPFHTFFLKTLFILSFDVQNLEIFIKSICLFFSFVAFCVLFQEIIARCNVMKSCPVFSCKSILVLGLIFRWFFFFFHLFVFIGG